MNCVFSVNVPTPIDMTDFWTTETMGVAAKPCECDADKLSAVERKELKIIEDSCQRLDASGQYRIHGNETRRNCPTMKYKLIRKSKQLRAACQNTGACSRLRQTNDGNDRGAVCTQAHKTGIGDIQGTSPLHCPPRDSETRKDNVHLQSSTHLLHFKVTD